MRTMLWKRYQIEYSAIYIYSIFLFIYEK